MEDIFLDKTKIEELDFIISLENDEENSKYILPDSKEEHFDLLSDNDKGHFTLKNQNGKILGFVILSGLKRDNVEFRRIVIGEKGQGFGRHTLRLVKKYCFEKLKCHRLWLDVLKNNDRARHLYLSEGFVEEGRLREAVKINDNYEDLVIMSVLENEYFRER